VKAIIVVVASALTLAAKGTADPGSVGRQIDIAEIEKTLHAIDVDRTSGHEGERQSAAYLEQKLS